MAPSKSVSELVNGNSVDVFMSTSELLLEYADNVLKEPLDPMFRKLRRNNTLVMRKLLPVNGGMECLFEMGFVEDGDYLILPNTVELDQVKKIRDELNDERNVILRNKEKIEAVATPIFAIPCYPVFQMLEYPSENVRKQMFYQKIISQMSHVLRYEDLGLQQRVLQVIPIAELEEEAKRMVETANQSSETGTKLDMHDCLVLALMNWFKTCFFKWIDNPLCQYCFDDTTAQGMAPFTQEELKWEACRVECFRCNSCKKFTRFPRYNNPEKLLDTREGRCGEWADCFTLCARAFGFEARFVLDWTDHAWTEVYSMSRQRWIHCDPSENVYDKPLLYEAGWGKKLTYVIAFSKEDIQDVSWRYSANHKELLQRRQECDESWVVNTIHMLNNEKLKSVPIARKQVLLNRLITELVEFGTEKTAEGQNLPGRTTGSITWRMSRGEAGNLANLRIEPYIFKLTEMEKKTRTFHLKYICCEDEYVRLSDNGFRSRDYRSMIYSFQNIFRMEELNSHMFFLARTMGSEKADISWKFDFGDSGLKINIIKIRVDSVSFGNGSISWLLWNDNQNAMLNGSPEIQIVKEMKNEVAFTLTATLRGGKEENAWLQTQLFRQFAYDISSSPFEIRIFFK